MTILDYSSIKDEEESDTIKEVRAIAQQQFVNLSVEHARTLAELERYRVAYRSASERAREISQLLREEI